MDRSQRSIQEYLSAARREPGISEQEVRAIVDAAPERLAVAEVPRWWRPILPWAMGLLIVGGGATALIIGDDTAPAVVTQFIRTTHPSAPEVPAPAPVATIENPTNAMVNPGPALAAAAPGEGRVVAPRALRIPPRTHSIPHRRDIESRNNSSISPITDRDDTMNMTHIRKIAGTTIVAAAIVSAANLFPPSAPAQMHHGDGDQTVSPAMARFHEEIGTAAYDYWIARLNDYKRTIDRTISSQDLARLNELRVRFAMMISEATVDADVNVQHDGSKHEGTVEMKIDGDDTEGFAKIQEFMSIYMEAKQLGAKYQTEFKPLGEGVMGDFFTFADDMSTRVDRFVSENRAEIAADKNSAHLLSARQDARTFIDELGTDKGRMGMQKIYGTVIEPMILLYDGAELSLILKQAAPFAKGVTGLTLPDASLLKQSVPNPASGSVTIGYTLKEPSDRTMLRLYNTSGALVGSFEQGSRPAGENSIALDVSNYPAGKYLYHLTIQTSKGEQVYSKSMQVVR